MGRKPIYHKNEFKLIVKVYDPVLKKYGQKSKWLHVKLTLGEVVDKETIYLLEGAFTKLYEENQ